MIREIAYFLLLVLEVLLSSLLQESAHARPTRCDTPCGDPMISLKSPEINSVDFKVLAQAKTLVGASAAPPCGAPRVHGRRTWYFLESPYLFWKCFSALFSRKAPMPSFLSWVPQVTPKASASKAEPVAMSVCMPMRMQRLDSDTAIWALAQMALASSLALGMSSSAG